MKFIYLKFKYIFFLFFILFIYSSYGNEDAFLGGILAPTTSTIIPPSFLPAGFNSALSLINGRIPETIGTLTDSEVRWYFLQYILQYNKLYTSIDFIYRYTVFKDNLLYILGFNRNINLKDLTSLRLNLNSFVDMTLKEFHETYMIDLSREEPVFREARVFQGSPKKIKTHSQKIATENEYIEDTEDTLTLPDSLDLRKYTPIIKFQGNCGSCYTFATTSALEAKFAKKYGYTYDLSEQQLLDCAQDPIYKNLGCGGGFMRSCFLYVMNAGGIVQQQSYGYEAKVNYCRYNSSNSVGTLGGYSIINKGDEDTIMLALATSGPVAAAIDANPKAFQFYSGGIFKDSSCTTTLTHAVLIVGYGTENGVPYFLVKNCWGTQWGLSGYFKIIRGRNMCGISNLCSLPNYDE